MKRPKIIIDDRIPYIEGLMESVAEVEYLPYAEITRQRITDADALIIRTRTHCNVDLLEGTAVRLVVTATIGMDHIDTEYCEAHGITVRNAPGCNSGSVAQWVRETLRLIDDEMINDKMMKDKMMKDCVGIVGCGNVGSKVKVVAESLGYRTMVSDPPKGIMTTLEEIAKECRIVTFHVPLTCDGEWKSEYMASERFFSLLRPDAVIINAARGGIVDERALKRWLREHPEGRCAIDCWEGEPEIDRELADMAMIATPHIAGYSADGKWNGTSASVMAVNEFFGIEAQMPAPLPPTTSHKYDIQRDSNALKREPERFEWFRGHYPERRE